jgi:hypothetical protein
MVVLRQYELPATWNNSTIIFCANCSPRLPSASALFYSDPANRVLVIAAKPASIKSSSSASPCNWLFINEGYFRGAPSRRDRLVIPWSVWGQYCLIKDLPRSRTLVRGPHAIGSRVVFLESESGSRAGSSSASLNLIEFVPFPDTPARLDTSWPVVGPRSALFPSETVRRLPSSTVEHCAVDDIGVTEDNIVLFLVSSGVFGGLILLTTCQELRPGFRPINILTFGAPPTRSSHR